MGEAHWPGGRARALQGRPSVHSCRLAQRRCRENTLPPCRLRSSVFSLHRPRRRSAGTSRVRSQKSVAHPPRRPAGLEDLFEKRVMSFRRKSPERLRECGGGDNIQDAANEFGDPGALEQNVLARRVNQQPSGFRFSNAHNSERIGVARTVGGAEGHQVAPPACPDLGWFLRDSETAKGTEPRAGGDRRAKRRWQREQHENSWAHAIPGTLRTQDVWTRHKTWRCGTRSSNWPPSAKKPSKPEMRVPTSRRRERRRQKLRVSTQL